MQACKEERRRNVLGRPGHQHATENPRHHRPESQEWRHQHTGHDTRQDQSLERIEAEHTHGVDLLLHLHGADRSGEGTIGPSGQHDGSDQHAELAQHGNPNQFDREHRNPDALQQVGAHIGNHRPDEEGQDGDNRQGVDADLFHRPDRRSEPETPRLEEAGQAGGQCLAEESKCVDSLAIGRFKPGADPRHRLHEAKGWHLLRPTDLGPLAYFLDQAAGGPVHADKMEIGIGCWAAPCGTPQQIGARRVDPAEMGEVNDDIAGVIGGFDGADSAIVSPDRIDDPIAMRLKDRALTILAHNQFGSRRRFVPHSPHGRDPSRYLSVAGVKKHGATERPPQAQARPEAS